MCSFTFTFIIFSHPKFEKHVKTLVHTHQTHNTHKQILKLYFNPESLNMYLLFITPKINSSGRAVTGARYSWQTAVALTDNMKYLSILHCNSPVSLSVSAFFFRTFPAPLLCLSKHSSPFSFSQVSWEMIPELNICHCNNPLKLNYTERNCEGGVDNKKGWRDGAFMK